MAPRCDGRSCVKEGTREVCTRTGHGPVDVIGHSLGGLIARRATTSSASVGTDARVHTLVTLGTPHGGTLLSRPCCPHIRSCVRCARTPRR
ncbi:esterase/lipase family protein [Streptomyces sp. 5-10]|uniref:esterase/lipase family protein n=1 Tax=Streptomyces sp. 5-10 TaxID=878925 RepID=UPI00351A9B56